jgi:hypothetical protein
MAARYGKESRAKVQDSHFDPINLFSKIYVIFKAAHYCLLYPATILNSYYFILGSHPDDFDNGKTAIQE